MPNSVCADYGFTIAPTGDAWAWTTYDRQGRVQAQGRARTRAVAAAFVVRELTRRRGAPERSGSAARDAA